MPAAARHVYVDQADQHEHRTQERVQEELHRRIHAARPAPDADDDEHRDQHALEEGVEQDRVDRAEHADHHAFEDQQRGEVLAHALAHRRSEEHTSELQSLMRTSYAVLCLKKTNNTTNTANTTTSQHPPNR